MSGSNFEVYFRVKGWRRERYTIIATPEVWRRLAAALTDKVETLSDRPDERRMLHLSGIQFNHDLDGMFDTGFSFYVGPAVDGKVVPPTSAPPSSWWVNSLFFLICAMYCLCTLVGLVVAGKWVFEHWF